MKVDIESLTKHLELIDEIVDEKHYVLEESNKSDIDSAFREGVNAALQYMKTEKPIESLVEAAKYGYKYHMDTSFPEKSFEENCKNNFLQWLNKDTIVNEEVLKCDECNSTRIKKTGKVLLSNPPLYEYVCDYCGTKQTKR